VTDRVLVDEATRLRFAPHVRFKFDERRARWVVLAPERMLLPDEIAVEVLHLCTGKARVADIVDEFTTKFEAPRDEIASDVIAVLQDLADKGVLVP
jgi:pyrroloquinoline quinone biosynthesis protein D